MPVHVRLISTIRRDPDKKLIAREGLIGTVDDADWEKTSFAVPVQFEAHERKRNIPRKHLQLVRYGLWDTRLLKMVGFDRGMSFATESQARMFVDPSNPDIIVVPVPPIPAAPPSRAYTAHAPRVYTRKELEELPTRAHNGTLSLQKIADEYGLKLKSRVSAIDQILQEQTYILI